MFSATDFFYDGKWSGELGLIIADLSSDNMAETTPFVTTLHTSKTSNSDRFLFSGISYDEAPTKTFNVFASDGSVITDIIQRKIISWLCGRKEFKKLQVLQPDLQGYEYNCIFNEVGKQFYNGNVVGLILTCTFDSRFAYGKPSKLVINKDIYDKVDSDGFLCQEKLVDGEPRFVYPRIANNSDVFDDYVYPVVTLDSLGADSIQKATIINITDNEFTGNSTRAFEFDLYPNEKITIENELKIVGYNPTENDAVGGDRLKDFHDKNWLRLTKGVNEIKAKIKGSITIECPQLVLIGW